MFRNRYAPQLRLLQSTEMVCMNLFLLLFMLYLLLPSTLYDNKLSFLLKTTLHLFKFDQ